MTVLAWLMVSAVSLAGCGGSLTDTGAASSLPLGQGVGVQTDKTPRATAQAAPLAAPLVTAQSTATETATRARTGNAATTGKTAGSSASKIADTLTASATPGSTAYKVGALDVLDISVFKAPELSKSVQVADSGTVNLPLIEDIQAAGRTAQEIERDVAAKLGAKYLQKPQVTVFVKEYNSQRVTIEGAVKKPGVFPVRGGNTLLQYLAMAEGLDPNSDSTVLVFRTTDGKRSAAKFDINEVRSGATPDPALVSGDVVVAPSSAMKEAFNNFIKVLPLASVFALL
jgi:polysaccharide biosynthesis/export protein